MNTYAQLMAQARELERQAHEARRAECAAVVQSIKQTMAEHGITIEMLAAKSKSAPPKAAKPARYVGPNGETWTGGAGRRPTWVNAVLANGGDIEAYRVL